MPAQVCYVYFTFHLLKLDGYGKPTHLEHYLPEECLRNEAGTWEAGTPTNPGQDRALPQDDEKRGEAAPLLQPRGSGGSTGGVCRPQQQRTLPRSPEKPHAGRCILWKDGRGNEDKAVN